MRRTPFTPQENSWYSFLLEAESPQGHRAAGRIKSIEKIHLIGTRTRTVPKADTVEILNRSLINLSRILGRDSSVGIATDYRMDDQGIGV
jgi:hypothetical protein